MTNVLASSVFAGGNLSGAFLRGIKWRDTGLAQTSDDIIIPFCAAGKRYLIRTKDEFSAGSAFSVDIYNIDTEETQNIVLRAGVSGREPWVYAYGQVGDKFLITSFLHYPSTSASTDFITNMIDSNLNVAQVSPDFVPTATDLKVSDWSYGSQPAGNVLFMTMKMKGESVNTNRFTVDGIHSAVTTTLPEIYFKGKLYYHTYSGTTARIYRMDITTNSSGVPTKTDTLVATVTATSDGKLYSFRDKVFLTQQGANSSDAGKYFIFPDDFSTPEEFPLEGTNLSAVSYITSINDTNAYRFKIPVCADRNSTIPVYADINHHTSSTDYGIRILTEQCAEIMFYCTTRSSTSPKVFAYGFDDCIFIIFHEVNNNDYCYRIEQG